MKGTENIIAQIRSDAQKQADVIISQAEQQCAAIRDDYAKQAKQRYAEKIRLGVKDCEDRADSMDRIAQMESRKALLTVKQEMVSAGFNKACDDITKLDKAEYVAFLARLASEAAVTGDEQIVLNDKDKALGAEIAAAANAKLAEKGVTAKLSLSAETGSFAGGLILRRGNIEVNCTVELLIELCRADMSAELAGVLFA